MKTKHTPEPWTAYRHTGPTGPMKVESANRVIAEVLKAETLDEQTANAERIAACVSACAGLNPEAVPELRTTLQMLLDTARVIDAGNKNQHGEDCHGFAPEVFELVERVIAKATVKE